MRRFKIIFSISILFFILQNVAFSAEIEFTASVDKTYLAQSDNLRITVNVSGPIGSMPAPNVPDLNIDFYILSGPNESTSYQIINSQMSASRSISYVIQPKRTGEIIIPESTLDYKGKQYKTEPIKINVVGQGAIAQPDQSGGSQKSEIAPNKLFLRAITDKKTLLQGDMVVLDFKLYFNTNISSYEITKTPVTAGFWTEEFSLPRQPIINTELIDGQRYSVATIKKLALFPTKSGKLTIDQMEVQCMVQDERRIRGRHDIFDSIFDDPFFGSAVNVPKYVKSDPINLNVLPYPEKNKPDNFNGAVGEFNLSVDLDKQSTVTNDPLTLLVKISGNGNVRFIPPPDIQVSPDFEKYDPEIDIQTNKSGGRISGTKTFKYLLIPRLPGRQRIEPVKFSYYSPNRKDYISIEKGGFDVEVARGKEIIMPGGVSIAPEQITLYGQDIRFIKPVANLQEIGGFIYKKPLYIMSYIVPLFLVFGVSMYRSFYSNRNFEYVRFKNAFRNAKDIIFKSKKNMSAIAQEEFYRLIEDGLKGFIADKLEISSTGLVIEEIRDLILEHGVKEVDYNNLKVLIEECGRRRFGSSTNESGTFKDIINRSYKLLQTMEDSWKR